MNLIELAVTHGIQDHFTTIKAERSVDCPVDIKYHEPVKVMVENLKPKMSRLQDFRFDYITHAFSDMGKVEERINEIGEEVPDGIILTLSGGLYGKHFNDLAPLEQGIIKVLSAYIYLVN